MRKNVCCVCLEVRCFGPHSMSLPAVILQSAVQEGEIQPFTFKDIEAASAISDRSRRRARSLIRRNGSFEDGPRRHGSRRYGHGRRPMFNERRESNELSKFKLMVGLDAVHLVVEEPVYHISTMACHKHPFPATLASRHRPPNSWLRMRAGGQQKIRTKSQCPSASFQR